MSGRRCLPLCIDVRKPETIAAAVDETLKEFGRIDILINSTWPRLDIKLFFKKRSSVKGFGLIINFSGDVSIFIFYHCTLVYKLLHHLKIITVVIKLNLFNLRFNAFINYFWNIQHFSCLTYDFHSLKMALVKVTVLFFFDRCCWKLPLSGCRTLFQWLQDSLGDRHNGYIQHQQGGLWEVVPGTVHFLCLCNIKFLS